MPNKLYDLAVRIGSYDKAAAREAYKARKASIDAEAASQQAPEWLTFAAASEALNTAGDVDTLDLKADLINRVEDEAHRAELSAMYRALREKLEN